MKKFKFSLETALKWKRSQEEEALRLMGLAMRKRQEAYDTLQAGRRHLGELLKTIRESRQGTVQGWTQVAYAREVGRQEGVCKNYEELLQRAIAQETAARETYLLRHREAEAMQKLREKRKITFQKEADRQSELELEEIMLSREGKAVCS